MSQPNGTKGTFTTSGAPKLDAPVLIEKTNDTAPAPQEAKSLNNDGHEPVSPEAKNPDKAIDAAESRLSGATPMAGAGRDYLAAQLKKLREAEPIARDGKDREGVHDMRVATRRLRENLRLLGEAGFNPTETGALRQKLKPLTRTLGKARDTDVFLEHLDTYDAQLPVDQRAGLAPLRKGLNKRYKSRHKALLKLLDDPKTGKLFDRLDRFSSDDKITLDTTSLDPAAVAPELVRHFAGSLIWQRYEAVLAYDAAVNPETSQETLHQLRMAFKRLRYTLEFFEEALSPTAKSLHQQLVEAQDDLGALHDDYTANIYMNKTVLNGKNPDQALLNYRDSREADSLKLRVSFWQKWRLLSGPKYKRQLAAEIAGLVAR
jgi:CHAD domain-containing protein